MPAVMWRRKDVKRLESRALAATPNHGIDLSGQWTSLVKDAAGDITLGVQLEQYGAAVYGWMQFKLAALHPLEIRGIVMDARRLVATQWRPHENGMGSGILDLQIESSGELLVGFGSWYDAGSAEELKYELHWRRNTT